MIGNGRRGRWLLVALMMLIATAIAPLAPGAGAGPAGMGPAVEESSPAPGGETDRWWGVAGAALCGLEIRFIIRVPAIGMNPYALAAGIAGCSLALLDIATT